MSDQLLEIKEATQAINTLRETVEKNGQESSAFKEMFVKTNAILEKQEKSNQELVTKQAEDAKEISALKEKYMGMESEVIRLSKSNVAGQDWRESPEYKAITVFAKGGERALNLEQKSILRTDNDTLGGYLINPEFSNKIIEKQREFSNVRSVAEVQTVGNKTITLPKDDALPLATFEGEAEAGPISAPTFASESLTAYRLTSEVHITQDMVMDSSFDMGNLVIKKVGQAKGIKEGLKFVKGTGAKQPEGFLSNAAVIASATNASVAGDVNMDDMIGLTGKLLEGYNPIYAFNRRTLAHLRLSKGTTNDHYIWQINAAGAAPNEIAGEKYIIFNDMPDYDGTAGEIPVMYADFFQGYRIIDRQGTTMIRDDFTAASNAIARLIFHSYLTGQVVLPEAFAGLKIIS